MTEQLGAIEGGLLDERKLPGTCRSTAFHLRTQLVFYNKTKSVGPLPTEDVAKLLENAALLIERLDRARHQAFLREEEYQKNIMRLRDSFERMQEWLTSSLERAIRRGEEGGLQACERILTDQAAPIWDTVEMAGNLEELGALLPSGLVSITIHDGKENHTYTLRGDGMWYENGIPVQNGLVQAFLNREVSDLE